MLRILAFFAAMAAYSAALSVGAATEPTQEAAETVTKEFSSLVEGIDAAGIFAHNLGIALALFIPGAGAGLAMYSAWATGYTLAHITFLLNAASSLPPLALLYLTPFGIMELTAYSIAASRSAMLAVALAKRAGAKRQILHACIEAGAVVGILAAAAYIEYHMIEAMRAPGAPALPGL